MSEFEQPVVAALREIFRTMRLTCAGRHDDPQRWSGDDLATDLAPYVTAAINDAVAAAATTSFSHGAIEQAALAALRGRWKP